MADEGNQPGIAILKAARIFDPASATLLSSAKEEYDSHIPGFKDVSRQEFELYLELARKEINSGLPRDPAVFVQAFWVSNSARLPKLYSMYSVFKNLSSSSSDTERSFSALKNILTKKRESLSQSNLKHLLFLN